MEIKKQFKVGSHNFAYVEEKETDISYNIKYYLVKDNSFIPISTLLYIKCAMVHNLDVKIEQYIKRFNINDFNEEEQPIAQEMLNYLNSIKDFSTELPPKKTDKE